MAGSSRRKRRVRRYRAGRRRSIMSTAAGPWVMIGACAAGVVAVVLLVVLVVIPYFNAPAQEPAPTVLEEQPAETPAPHLVQITELGALQTELSLSQRYVSSPWFCGEKMVFSAGTDEAGSPKMAGIYVYDSAEGGAPEQLNISLENDDFFSLRMNEKWIVFLDGKRQGGGLIKAYDRESGRVSLIKECFAAQPVLSLMDDLVVWTERTGTYMDKLYAYDLTSGEEVTLATFENNRYGQSDPSAANGEIIWAEAEGAQQEGEAPKSVIRALRTDGSGEIASFSAGSYVHDPVTNGRDWAWMDSDHGEGAKLYVSKNRGEPFVLAENVLAYGISEEFVAYQQGDSIYVYFFADGYEQIITPARELVQLVGVSDGKVLWYETGVSSRDVLKFAPVS